MLGKVHRQSHKTMLASAKLRRLIIYISHFYSFFLGLATVWIDYDRKCIVEYRKLRMYSVLINIVIFVTAPIVSKRSLQYFNAFEQDEFMQLSDVSIITLNYTMIALTLALRNSREKRFVAAANEIIQLDMKYFDKYPKVESIEQHYNKVFNIKSITAFGNAALVIYSLFQITTTVNLETILISLYISNTMNIIHGVLFIYMTQLWVAYKRFLLLNYELQRLLAKLKQLNADRGLLLTGDSMLLRHLYDLEAEDLHQTCKIHKQLTDLVERLSDSFKFQLTSLLLTYLVRNTSFGFYALLSVNGTLDVVPSASSMLLGFSLYMVVVFDLYLVFWSCDAISNAQQSTAQILSEFYALPFLTVELQRRLDGFTLQLGQCKLYINAFGMFNLNQGTSMSIWDYIIKTTFIFVIFEAEKRAIQDAEKKSTMIHKTNGTSK